MQAGIKYQKQIDNWKGDVSDECPLRTQSNLAVFLYFPLDKLSFISREKIFNPLQ